MTERDILGLCGCKPSMMAERKELARGEEDFRQVFIVEDGARRLVIKQTANAFSGRERILGWERLMREYNRLGIYCPAFIPNVRGETIAEYEQGGRTYCVYAEKFARYPTAEAIGSETLRDENGRPCYFDGLFRSLGTVAAAHLDVMDWPSGYCLLEPFCPPDTCDEQTDCVELFLRHIREQLPEFSDRADVLEALFYRNQTALREVYGQLPTSCFQADLGDGNVLIDGRRFAGLIDFNLSGRETILNYTVRAALWMTRFEQSLYDEAGNARWYYDRAADDERVSLVMRNLSLIQGNYHYTDMECETFPAMLRYLNAPWWFHISELRRVQADRAQAVALLDWLERQMTREDVRL